MLLLVCNEIKAQQAPMFTNYSNSYAVINPGYAGLSEGVNILGIYRDQWSGFKDMDGNRVSPRTLLFSGDIPVRFLRGGLALGIMKDEIGFENNVSVNLGYSYHFDLGAGTLGLGAAFNLVNRSMDFSKLNPLVSSDPFLPTGEETSMLFDANLGLFWMVPETYYIGFSVTNLFESKGKELVGSAESSASFVGDRTFYLVAGFEYQFTNSLFAILPSLCIMSDVASTQYNIGSKVMYNDRFWVGLNYRFQESVDIMAGIKIKDLQISYAYDINTLGLAVPGSHEVSISYCFKLDLDKHPRIYRSIRYL